MLRRQGGVHASARNEAWMHLFLGHARRGGCRRRWRPRGRRRRGRSGRARPSRWCTRGRCGLGGLVADHAVDLLLGADVDAAHRVVHDDDAGVGGERAGEERLLLVAAGEREDGVLHVGGADADLRCASPRRRRVSAPRVEERALQEAAERGDGDVARRWTRAGRRRRSAGRRRRAPPGRRPGCRARGRRSAREAWVWPWPAEAGEADDLARVGDELGRGGRRARRARPARKRRVRHRGRGVGGARGGRRCPWRARARCGRRPVPGRGR